MGIRHCGAVRCAPEAAEQRTPKRRGDGEDVRTEPPPTVLQLCPVSGNFIEMIFFFQLCILRAVKTIFYLCLLSELKALVIAEYPPINIIKCFIFLISHHALSLSDFIHYNNFRQKLQSADTTKTP